MAYKIQKGVGKVPGERFKYGQVTWKYPLDKMKVGDSFAIPEEEYSRPTQAKIRGRIISIINNTGDKELAKMKFSIGRDPETKKCVRVWRIL